jgi:hypothetical protein
MKQCLLIFAILYSNHVSFGQGKIKLKMYQNTDLFDISYTKYDDNLGKYVSGLSHKTNFNRISLAIQIRAKNKLVHEIELLIPELSKVTTNPQFPFPYSFDYRWQIEPYYSVSTVSIRYEVGKTLYSYGNLNLDLGVGINPYYISGHFIPPFTTTFERTHKYVGFSFNVTPRISYIISKRFGVEINSPFKIYDLIESTLHIDNPSIPIRQQTVSETKSEFFSNVYTIRFGVSYSFKK